MGVEVRRSAQGLTLELSGAWGARELTDLEAELAAVDVHAARELRIATSGVTRLDLSGALAAYGAKVRAGINAAAELGDADTSDLFTAVSRDTDKYLWFLEAHLHAKR